jgi:tetratricopeptide (TPR) repeat protein
MSLLSAVYVGIGVTLEGMMVVAFWKQEPLLSQAEYHLLAVLCLAAAYVRYISDRKTSQQGEKGRHGFALLVTAFFPGIGLIASILFYYATRNRSKASEESEEDLFEDLSADPLRTAVEGEESLPNLLRRVRSEMNFQPMIDIIRGHEAKAKAKAIFLLSRSVSAENVTLLKEALKDTNPEIRLYAASALLKIESGLNVKIQKARELTEQRGYYNDFTELGDVYAAYARIGITDEALSSFYLELASAAYRSALDIFTEQPEVAARYAQCLISLKQYDKALGFIDHAARTWPSHAGIIFLRNETYFDLGQYKDIGKTFSQIADQPLNEVQQRIVEFWTIPR